MAEPEARDPLAGLEWADDDPPLCSWCDDTGWRWTIRGDQAEMVRCDKCFQGEDDE